MSVLHLFWIIPVAATVGFIFCALLSANKEKNGE